MKLEATPEPSNAEREALLEALAALLERPPADPGPWWRRGAEENVLDAEDVA